MYRTLEGFQADLPPGQTIVALSQGDILDDCPLVFWADPTRQVSADVLPLRLQARVFVLTQACDLANDKAARATVAVVQDAMHLIASGRVKERFVRDNIRRGQVYGWYFLPAHTTAPGFPESLVDLRTSTRSRGRCWRRYGMTESTSAGS
jgi:hypothetical protein